MTGESVLSLLIVDLADENAEFYLTFFCWNCVSDPPPIPLFQIAATYS